MSRFDIDPQTFVQRLEEGGLQDSLIVDVREQEEWEYYHLEEAELIPMQTIPERLHELPQDKIMYVVCAHGVRSAHVCNYLIANGFTNLRNVQGGMAAVAALRGFDYD